MLRYIYFVFYNNEKSFIYRAHLNCRIYKTYKKKDIDTYFFSL